MLRATCFLVAVVGTQGEQTSPDQQGRVLGLVEPTREEVRSSDFPIVARAVDLNAEGGYRWPFALLCRAAWSIANPPPLSQITDRRFNMDAAQGIVLLEPPEAAAILALPREPARLLETFRTVARLEGEAAARRRGAPPPQTTRQGVMHMRRAPAHTYLFAIEGARRNGHSAAAYKVGWAFDIQLRARTFNSASLPDLGGLRYRPLFGEMWPTAKEAFLMEQEVLRQFRDQQSPSNREVIVGITSDEIEEVWRVIAARLRQQRR